MKKYVLVDNYKAVDVTHSKIRPKIKKKKCLLVRIIEGEHSLSPKTYVVKHNGEEVYLNRHEIID